MLDYSTDKPEVEFFSETSQRPNACRNITSLRTQIDKALSGKHVQPIPPQLLANFRRWKDRKHIASLLHDPPPLAVERSHARIVNPIFPNDVNQAKQE